MLFVLFDFPGSMAEGDLGASEVPISQIGEVMAMLIGNDTPWFLNRQPEKSRVVKERARQRALLPANRALMNGT